MQQGGKAEATIQMAPRQRSISLTTKMTPRHTRHKSTSSLLWVRAFQYPRQGRGLSTEIHLLNNFTIQTLRWAHRQGSSRPQPGQFALIKFASHPKITTSLVALPLAKAILTPILPTPPSPEISSKHVCACSNIALLPARGWTCTVAPKRRLQVPFSWGFWRWEAERFKFHYACY